MFAGSLKFSPSGQWFCPWGKISQGTLWNICPTFDDFLALVEPLFHLPHKGEGKQTEPDASWCDVIDDDSVAQLKEVLQVCTCVLAWQTTELVRLHHHYEACPELKVSGAYVDSGPNGHIGNSGGGVVTE